MSDAGTSAAFPPDGFSPSARSRWTARALRVTMRPLTAVFPPNVLGITGARMLFRAGMGALVAPDRGTSVEPVRARCGGVDVRGEWVRGPHVQDGGAVVLYIHGSGYVLCSARTHRGLVSRVSSACVVPALSIEYRMAPEHCFPAAADDALAAYRWLLEQGFAGRDIVVAGDSAGGHLAITLACDARRLGLPAPAGLVLFSPLTDPTLALGAERDRICCDPMVTARGARVLVDLYTRGADPEDPRLAPLRCDPAGLPPMLLQTGERELLSADGEAFAALVDAAGGSCELQVWPGQVHVFQALYRLVPEAQLAIDEAGRFIRRVLAQPVSSRTRAA